jgi:hypothetical protein
MTCHNSALETASSPASIARSQFVTTDLDLAAYLKTIGHRLIGTQPQGRFVAFIFGQSAQADAEMYLTGAAAAPVHAVLENYRVLRTLIVEKERQKKYARTTTFNQF